jgi:hypothetical protein
MVKLWDVITETYWTDDDGKLYLYNSEEEAKQVLREEGYKESFIQTAVEYVPHGIIDKSGYDLQ